MKKKNRCRERKRSVQYYLANVAAGGSVENDHRKTTKNWGKWKNDKVEKL